MSEPTEKIEGAGAIAWMARNPVAANLIMAFLLIGGLLMGARVKQEVFPETELDMISISVPYPGASPAEVEQGIILAVEEAVRGIDGVKRVVERYHLEDFATWGKASVVFQGITAAAAVGIFILLAMKYSKE